MRSGTHRSRVGARKKRHRPVLFTRFRSPLQICAERFGPARVAVRALAGLCGRRSQPGRSYVALTNRVLLVSGDEHVDLAAIARLDRAAAPRNSASALKSLANSDSVAKTRSETKTPGTP
jgi:hypothetical protein